MAELLFGPAGVPISTPKGGTLNGIKRVKELGLGCMELEFVQSVRMGKETALKVKELSQELGIRLTVHAPYYINFNSKEKDKVEASKKRLLDAARVGYLAGAESVVFHAAYYHDDKPKDVYRRVKKALKEVVDILKSEGVSIDIRPETTGKPTQFGTLEETIKLSLEIEGVYPCVDFAHLHAREMGGLNSYDEFIGILQFIEREIGKDALKRMHIHISGINYGDKGEKNHVNLKESDLKYRELLKALKDKGVTGFIISESPNLEEDALLMMEIYRKV
jgi:deoxyribonuclease-4